MSIRKPVLEMGKSFGFRGLMLRKWVRAREALRKMGAPWGGKALIAPDAYLRKLDAEIAEARAQERQMDGWL